jgi:trehalose 6-phosphate synthase
MKAALLEACRADERETNRRMKAMRKTVLANDVVAWANSFLEGLSAERPSHGKQVRPATRS